MSFFFFFFNDTATTEIYTLSLHDALPISCTDPNHDGSHGDGAIPRSVQREQRVSAILRGELGGAIEEGHAERGRVRLEIQDRKSTRLNSSHANISYAVFCLKKKKKKLNPV